MVPPDTKPVLARLVDKIDKPPAPTNKLPAENRAAYLNNVSEDSIRQSYEFGSNVVVHLLTCSEK